MSNKKLPPASRRSNPLLIWPLDAEEEEEMELFIDNDAEGEWNCEVPMDDYLKELTQIYCGKHEWETYQGIYEAWEYCKHCDIKRKDFKDDSI